MKLRYYCRGLGIGMVVTALVMGIATKEGLPLTDAEIKAKALALGMVEEDSIRLSDIQTLGEQEPGGETMGDAGLSGETPEDGGKTPEDTGKLPEDTGGSSESAGRPLEDASEPLEDDKSPAETEDSSQGISGQAEPETITITVEPGTGSYKVCEQLEEAGLVEDAWEFDKYVIDNDCSKKIHAGTHRIPVGAGWEEILGILTKTGN